MTSFFDKLKKGMNIENTPNLQENLENSEQDLPEEPSPENEKPSIEKPSVTLVSTSISGKKTSKKTTTRPPHPRSLPKVGGRREGWSPASRAPIKKETKRKKIRVEKEPDRERVEVPKEKKWFEPEGELTVDVYQTDNEIVIQSAVAGIKPEDLDISIENDMITIKGIREKFLEKEEKNYFYQECYWGRFSRKIISPVEIDGSRAKATIKQGILTIRIPKIERKKKRRIVVRE